MGMEVTWVGYGPPAAAALADALSSAKEGEPLAPVCVVVPSNHVGVSARRALASGATGTVCASGSGICAVTFVTVYRLAELLGAPAVAVGGRRPVSTPVVAAALRGALGEDPGVFAPVADHPATELALVAAYRELRDLSEGALAGLASAGRRAADVVRLHRRARARLEPGLSDEEDLMDAAVTAVTTDPVLARRLGPVIVYLPQRLSRHGAALLVALTDHTDVTVLAGTTGDHAADAMVRQSLVRLTGVEPVGPGLGSGPSAAQIEAPTTRVVTLSDADDEVRVAVRAVVDEARRGTSLDRMAILYSVADPYARVVHEQLDAAGVAHNGMSVVPLTARVAGRTLLGLLALADGAFRREALFAWLAGAPVRHRGRWVRSAAWERLSRDAGVVGGRTDWDRRLETLAADCDAEAERADADADSPPWRAEGWRRDAERARQLRGFALELIDDLARADVRRRWSEHAAWARSRMSAVLGGPLSRTGFPLSEQKAHERTERALDRLARLDDVEGAVGLDVFRRTLELELEADLGRVGRMGEGVLVGSVRMGAGLDLDLAVVLGLAEGSFPARVRDDSLLPDHERARALGEMPRRDDEVERQHHDLLAALAGARHHVLCIPRGDLRRNSEHVPCRWISSVVDRAEHVASFDAGLRRLEVPSTEQEFRLQALLADGSSGAPGAQLGDAVLDAGVEMTAARRGVAFTRFDGNLHGLCVPSPADEVCSATRLERWARCPFAYFAVELLHVDPVENPEDRLHISPLDLGSLVHDVLERFVAEVLERPAEQQPAPDAPWTAADRHRLHAIALSVCDHYEARGLVGRALFWRRDRRRLLGNLDRFLREDSAHRATHRTRPVAAELSFGLSGSALGTVALGLPDGRAVRLRGKADRLDEADDGSLEVLDYKTGGAGSAYTALSEDEPDGNGTRLQLPVYALAARAARGRPDAPVRAEYWFVSAKGNFRRYGYTVTDDVLARVGATVGRMAEGIEAGVFPPHPSASSTSPFIECPYCDPDGIGVTDLRRQMDRKLADPALGAFTELAQWRGEASDE